MEKFWERYYALKARLREKENLEEEFVQLADDVVDVANEEFTNRSVKEMDSLSNLFYHCQEILAFNYGTSSQKVFPTYSTIEKPSEDLKARAIIELVSSKIYDIITDSFLPIHGAVVPVPAKNRRVMVESEKPFTADRSYHFRAKQRGVVGRVARIQKIRERLIAQEIQAQISPVLEDLLKLR